VPPVSVGVVDVTGFSTMPLPMTLVPSRVTVCAPAKRMLLTSVGPAAVTLPVTSMFLPAVQVVVPLAV